MKKTKLLCLFLAFVLCLLSVVSCNLDEDYGEDEDDTDTSDKDTPDKGSSGGIGNLIGGIGNIIGGIDDTIGGKDDPDVGDDEDEAEDPDNGILEDGTIDWDVVDFDGATVKFGISVSSFSGGNYKPAKDYLKGPDSSSTDAVLKKVKARNNRVERDLNMTVKYVELEANNYLAVQNEIRAMACGSSCSFINI